MVNYGTGFSGFFIFVLITWFFFFNRISVYSIIEEKKKISSFYSSYCLIKVM